MEVDSDDTSVRNGTHAARTVGLTKIYGTGGAAVRALDSIDVEIESARFTAIMGPSGSGKSTLMHCMAGLDSVSGGQVFIGDTEITGLADRQLTRLRRTHVGFIFQSFNLVPTLTARENIILPLTIARQPVDEAWVDHVVDVVGIRERLGHRPSELSGGQQQRVACARALATRPAIVFADEPTGNLDSTSGREILEFLRHSVDEFGQSIVMVTHEDEAAAYADRIIRLSDGLLTDDQTQTPRRPALNRFE